MELSIRVKVIKGYDSLETPYWKWEIVERFPVAFLWGALRRDGGRSQCHGNVFSRFFEHMEGSADHPHLSLSFSLSFSKLCLELVFALVFLNLVLVYFFLKLISFLFLIVVLVIVF